MICKVHFTIGNSFQSSLTANEGPVRIQYKCLVPIYVFPEMQLIFPKQNYIVLSLNSYTHISVRDLYISRIGLPILLREISGRILGIYKSLTDTWMWKLELRPCNSQKKGIYKWDFPCSAAPLRTFAAPLPIAYPVAKVSLGADFVKFSGFLSLMKTYQVAPLSARSS